MSMLLLAERDLADMVLLGNKYNTTGQANHYKLSILSLQLMNLNRGRLPPSPQSRHAKKPLILALKYCSSSLDNKKSSTSSKSILNNSIQHARPQHNSQTANPQPSSFPKEQDQPQCLNHKGRKAINFTAGKQRQYFCFECSLYQARKGNRLLPLEQGVTSRIQKQAQDRQKELGQFLKDSESVENRLLFYYDQKQKQLSRCTQHYAHLLERERAMFEEKIKSLTRQYENSLLFIERAKQKETLHIRASLQKLQESLQQTRSKRMDVRLNYKQCLEGFSFTQYRTIMDKYWKQLGQCTVTLNGVGPDTFYSPKSISTREDIRDPLESPREFTFSKNRSRGTPGSPGNFQGINFIQSVPMFYGPLKKEETLNTKL